jgi:hypothetical protein
MLDSLAISVQIDMNQMIKERFVMKRGGLMAAFLDNGKLVPPAR